MQRVERMEELLLRPVFAGKELDVVDEQDIDRPGLVPELTHSRVGDGADHLIGELLRGEVDNPLAWKPAVDLMADCVHQVRLAETHTSVQEQRVVAVAGSFSDSLRGRMGELRVVTDHEGGELEATIELRDRYRRLIRKGLLLVAVVPVLTGGSRHVNLDRSHRGAVACGRDNEVDVDICAGDGFEGFLNQAGETVLQPILR